MSDESRAPRITETAFRCPHCGAYTTQYWFKVYPEAYDENSRTPVIPTLEMLKTYQTNTHASPEDMKGFIEWYENMKLGKPYFDPSSANLYHRPVVANCNLSQCYNCNEIAIWVHDKIVYPGAKMDILPNKDMPEHVRQPFEEAREIVGASPKGAAALLRLCVQSLCIELGESGKNIDQDIASLVKKGLNPVVQQALDVVRVIGNESVHPGTIDLNDNTDIATKLFGLVNLICDQMISHPKQVNELYEGLPAEKIRGIEQRDKPTKGEH